MKTDSILKRDPIDRDWFLVDATDLVLGRLATNVAHVLKGKHLPVYSPSVDNGDHVIIINAEKIRVSGKKAEQKVYHHHSGYTGGLKTTSFKQLQETKPEEIIRHAIKGMLPKNSLGRHMIKKLRIYKGAQHPHKAQNPKPFGLN